MKGVMIESSRTTWVLAADYFIINSPKSIHQSVWMMMKLYDNYENDDNYDIKVILSKNYYYYNFISLNIYIFQFIHFIN
jgi:hypothetical protein